MTGSDAAFQRLLEREGELARIRAQLDAAASGHGGVVLIRGPAGIGKTSLLEAAAELAAASQVTRSPGTSRSWRRMIARGGEFESDFAFGIVRSLFEPVLRAAGEEDRARLLSGAADFARPALDLRAPLEPPPLGADPAASIMHGLYWLMANLAEEQPLLAVVDDAQWADASSLRFLEYLARRVDELGVLLAVGVRTGEEPAAPLALEALAADPRTTVLEPAPLGIEGVSALAIEAMDEEPAEAFCAACRDATGGNPFLVRALLDELAGDHVRPNEAAAAAVPQVRPRTVSRTVVLRLARLPRACEKLAFAVAVLGGGTPLRHAAAVAGLDEDEAADAADRLATSGLLAQARVLDFVHPLVRGVLLEELAPARRARLHAEAARVLHAAGAPADAVAAQLLAAEPAGEPWRVQALRNAARGALARGAADAAVALLARALEEPPEDAELPQLLLELGTTEARVFAPGAIEHLERAATLVEEPRARVEAAVELGRALLLGGRVDQALSAFARGRAAVAADHPELAFELDLDFVGSARFAPSMRALALERLHVLSESEPPSEVARLRLLANLAMDALGRETADRVSELATAALAGGQLVALESIDAPTFWYPLWALVYADRFDVAERELERVFTAAAGRGSARTFSIACCVRAMLDHRTGALAEVPASAERAAEVPGGLLAQPFALDAHVRSLLERGLVDDAAAALAGAGVAEHVPDAPPFWSVLSARGCVAIARGAVRAGVEDCLAAGERARAWRSRSPTMLPWRTDAALGLLALGERERALELAREAVELTRAFGAPRALGTALRVAGLAEGGEAGIALAHEAVAVLENSRARLEHAHALVDLGAAVRRAGHTVEARESLRAGLESAHACGAEPLAERAREELLAAGARPRRPQLSGADALTASEQRVASLAAQGMTNREIAQALFITPKTVEIHLTRSYRKLDVHGRDELAGALAATAA